MKQTDKIEIIFPKPYAHVGAEFVLSGRIPKSWLKTSWGGMDYRVLGGFLDIKGLEFASTVTAYVKHDLFSVFRKKLYFSTTAQFSQFNVPFIAESQGCIALKLSGHKENSDFFLPLIVDGFEPNEGVDPEILNRHGKIGDIVTQYQQDLKNYYKELEKIAADRKIKDENKEHKYLYGANIDIAVGISKILEESEENFEDYLYSEEDRREQELEEKYKEAVKWRGPLLRGIVSQFGGFELRVYSNDHDKHFHIIHKGKRINARFSFPELRLMNYKKSKNTISRKVEEKIRAFCQTPEVFQRFEKEFQKRT